MRKNVQARLQALIQRQSVQFNSADVVLAGGVSVTYGVNTGSTVVGESASLRLPGRGHTSKIV